MTMNPHHDVVFFYNDYESLGIEYISSALRRAGYTTTLVYENLVDYYAFDTNQRLDEKKIAQIAARICAGQPRVLALSPQFNRKGYHYPIVVGDDCINCEACAKICPEFAIFSTAAPSPSKKGKAVSSALWEKRDGELLGSHR